MSNQRISPRVDTHLTVEVTNFLGESTQTVIRNVSPGGMMIDGDVTAKELIMAGSDVQPMEISVDWQLPHDLTRLNVRCRLVFVRRLSQSVYNFGLRFVNVTEHQALALEQYVRQQLGHHK